MKRVLDIGKGLAVLGLRVAQAVLLAVYAVVRLLCGLIGARPPAPPKLPIPQATPSTALNTYEDALERAIRRDHDPVHGVGAAVHHYASAGEPWIRGAVDLTGLSDTQFAWLMGLSDADLMKLAEAGPLACQRAVSGKRSGIVGLPEMMSRQEPHPAEVDPREHMREAFRQRLGEDGRQRMAAAA